MSKQYSDEERKAICELWRQSGLSKNEYCKQEGNVSEYALRKWLKMNEVSVDLESAPIKFLQINRVRPKLYV